MALQQIAVALVILATLCSGIARATDNGSATPPLATTDDGPMVAPVKRMKPQMPENKAKPTVPPAKSAAGTPVKPTSKAGATERR